MNKWKIPLAKPIFDEKMKEAAIYALENERFLLGESTLKFEEEFANYCEVDHAISVSSGTNALHLSLLSIGTKKNNYVITSPASYAATANVVIHANATPKFCDININTYNIDPELITKKISKNTSSLIPVYLYGRPVEINEIKEIAEKNNIKVIADAAQAHGSKYRGKKTGGFFDATCFSFYPSKCMTVCGDGGMVTTNNEKISKKIQKLRDGGRSGHYIHDMIGYTSRLNNVNAAIGRIQLKNLDKWNEKRKQIVKKYNKKLENISDIKTPPKDNNEYESSHYMYVIRTKKRDELKKYLEEKKIECGIHYPTPIHLQPIYKQKYGYKKGDFQKAELLSETALSLPLFPELNDVELKYIIKNITSFYD